MKLAKNILLNTDSYKCSQFAQYPAGTEYIYSYIESRGGRWDRTVFFGLQAFLREYLTTPVTMADIDVAEKIITAHGEPFNREGWEYMAHQLLGNCPASRSVVSHYCGHQQLHESANHPAWPGRNW
jgi:nicotinamide phosphoribosyltransferase